LADLLFQRLLRLPNSIRRLAVLAAIMGQKFDADMLQKAADEHPAVVEIGLEMMLERWLIRQFADAWTNNQPRRDVDLFSKGARRGNFEFNHKVIREAFYSKPNPQRREVMHRDLAKTLEEAQGEGSQRYCELLAYHYLASEDWQPALHNLRLSGRKAHDLLAKETATYYYDLALEILGRVKDQAQTPRMLSKLRQQEQELEQALEDIALL
jgi:predicted ATPase